jgi:hypothetical protein
MTGRKYLMIILMMAFAATNCFAQKKDAARPWQFHSINNIGLIEGQKGSAFQLQTINGAQYKSWFAGVGIGLDYYRFRTIPLFADFRKEFGKTKNKFFVYADAGIDFYWKKDKDAKQFPVDDKFKNGFYCETGIGYKLKINQKIALLFSGGYSYKKITEEGGNYYFDPPIGPNSTYPVQKINYNLNRLVLKIGIEF